MPKVASARSWNARSSNILSQKLKFLKIDSKKSKMRSLFKINCKKVFSVVATACWCIQFSPLTAFWFLIFHYVMLVALLLVYRRTRVLMSGGGGGGLQKLKRFLGDGETEKIPCMIWQSYLSARSRLLAKIISIDVWKNSGSSTS